MVARLYIITGATKMRVRGNRFHVMLDLPNIS